MGGDGSHRGLSVAMVDDWTGFLILLLSLSVFIPGLSLGLLVVTIFSRKRIWPYAVCVSVVTLLQLAIIFAYAQGNPIWSEYWHSIPAITGWPTVILSTLIVIVRKIRENGAAARDKRK